VLVNLAREHGFEVSVLFNEPKLLKLSVMTDEQLNAAGFSALQRAEIAEMQMTRVGRVE